VKRKGEHPQVAVLRTSEVLRSLPSGSAIHHSKHIKMFLYHLNTLKIFKL
jgi:hypothetical protein